MEIGLNRFGTKVTVKKILHESLLKVSFLWIIMTERSTLEDQISKKLRKYSAELSESCPLILAKYPLHLYDKKIKLYKEYFNLTFFNAKLVEVFDGIKKEFDVHALALYQKLALCTFIADAINEFDSQNLPEPIIALYRKWFGRVYRDFSVQPDSYYHDAKESFCKDLAVCSLKAIPVGGAWVVELSRVCTTFKLMKGWPCFRNSAYIFLGEDRNRGIKTVKEKMLTLLVNYRLNKGILSLFLFLFKILKVYKLYYVIHTVDRYLPRFNKEQMNKAYINIANLLEINPDIYGIYRESWFLDPFLKNISPELAYLWEVPQQSGAKLFCIGNPHKAANKAISMSPLRKRLYEKGEYKPMNYAYVWPREELLSWANMVSRNL